MKKALTILLAVAMMFCFSATAFAAQFNDVDKSSKVAKDAINKVAALGIVDGYEDGGFHPGDSITRAEFAKMADIAAGLKDSAKQMEGVNSEFTDVKTGVWYTGWVNLASAQGYVKGYENGTYGPNNTITYAEVVTVLMRLLGYNDNLTGPWPINYINQATKLDVLDDVENFSANANATRSDVAIMLAETLDQNMVKWVSDDNEFQDKEKNKETYTLLEDGFDGQTVQDYVDEISVTDQVDGEYDIVVGDKTYNADMDTAVAGAEAYQLVGRQVTVIFDDDKYAAYVQVDDDVIKVKEAELQNDGKRVKFDGKSYKTSKDYADFDEDTANLNLNGYAQIDDDDEAVYWNTDKACGEKFYGKYELVTDVDTDDEDAYEVTTENDTYKADADDAIFVKNGKRITAKDIKVGDVLVKGLNGQKEIKDMYGVIANPSFEGVVTDFEGTYSAVEIDDVMYGLATDKSYDDADLDDNSALNLKARFDNKEKVTVYVNAANDVFAMIDKNESSDSNYGIILGITEKSNVLTNTEVDKVTIYTAEGKTVDFDVDWKDGYTYDSRDFIKGYPVKYELNKDGEIEGLYAKFENLREFDTTEAVSVKNNKLVDNKYSVNSNAVIFNVEDDYEVSLMKKADILADDISANDTDELKAYFYYVLDDDNNIEFMAITNCKGSNENYAIVTAVPTAQKITLDGKKYDLKSGALGDGVAKNMFVTYKLSGDEVTSVKLVDFDTFVDNSTEAQITKIGGDDNIFAGDSVFSATSDCVYVKYIEKDNKYEYASKNKVVKADNYVKVVWSDDKDRDEAEVIVFVDKAE